LRSSLSVEPPLRERLDEETEKGKQKREQSHKKAIFHHRLAAQTNSLVSQSQLSLVSWNITVTKYIVAELSMAIPCRQMERRVSPLEGLRLVCE